VLQERWLPWKAGLYDLEVVSPWGRYFQMGGLAYDIVRVEDNRLDLFLFLFSFIFLFWTYD